MSEKVDIFMPLFVADYLADTTDLTAEEHGAYLLLLMASWRNGGVLENDPQRLSRTAKVPPKRWPAVWDAIGRFFDVEGKNISQGRLVDELEKARGRKAAASENGARGAAKRWGGYGQAIGSPVANDVAKNSSSPSPSPSQEEKALPAPAPAPAIPGGTWSAFDWYQRFSRFWGEKYGRFYGQGEGDSKAIAALGDFLASMPLDERTAAQLLATEMLAEYLDDASPGRVKARHPWKWFVEGFNGLRAPKVRVAAKGPGPPRDTRHGHARAEDQKHTKTGEVEV